MGLTRLFLSFLVLTTCKKFFCVLCDHFKRFDHGVFLNGTICAEGKVVRTTNLFNDVTCLSLCTAQTSCYGVFLAHDPTQCVACSARFFYQNVSINTKFYKRYEDPSLSFYMLVTRRLTWYNAKQNCENHGGHLLILNSKEEMDFIYPYVVEANGFPNIHIGAKGTGGKADTFEWVDGTKVSNGYSNWRRGQPYPDDNTEKYVYMVKDWNYKWNDSLDKQRQSICEFN